MIGATRIAFMVSIVCCISTVSLAQPQPDLLDNGSDIGGEVRPDLTEIYRSRDWLRPPAPLARPAAPPARPAAPPARPAAPPARGSELVTDGELAGKGERLSYSPLRRAGNEPIRLPLGMQRYAPGDHPAVGAYQSQVRAELSDENEEALQEVREARAKAEAIIGTVAKGLLRFLQGGKILSVKSLLLMSPDLNQGEMELVLEMLAEAEQQHLLEQEQLPLKTLEPGWLRHPNAAPQGNRGH